MFVIIGLVVVFGSILAGFVITPDNWSMFTGWHTRETTIGNFPMQGGGSTILREAVKLLAQENDIEFVCSHHDALYARRSGDAPYAAAAPDSD